jgi:pimeloyl-ACP methyl ester carboxylesterase
LNTRFSEHTVQLGQCNLFYLKSQNSADETPILFLHGWGISTEPYQEVFSLLARQHPIIAPDLPSFAKSNYPDILPNYDSYATILIQFIEKLNLKSVHLVGHSLGGGISIALASRIPDRIESLTLIDSTGLPAGSVAEVLVRRAIEMPLQISIPKLKLQFVDIPQVFLTNLLFNTPNVFQALLISLQEDLGDRLPQIKSPCLLLWSEKDLTTLLPLGQKMKRCIPNAQLVIVEEGFHEWGLIYPEKLTSLILNFITQTDAAFVA